MKKEENLTMDEMNALLNYIDRFGIIFKCTRYFISL